MSLTSAPVIPCSCADGWKPEGWAYCAECYEGQIERLHAEKLELANHIDGCVRVAADALKRAEAAEALLAIVNSPADRKGEA